MKIRLILIFTLLFTQLFLNTSAQTTKIRLQLKWWDQFQFAGFYAAEIKGFYEAENLDVDILPGKQNISPVSEVMNGNADFAVTGADLLVHFTEGQPLKVLGAIFQHSPYVVISPKENNIYNPINFIGKKVMCSQNQGLVELKAMALRNRVPLNSIIFKEHTWNNNDLINGNADAMTGYTSVEVFQLEEKGVTLNLVKPSNYGIDFYGDVIFCSKETVEKRRGITDRFLKASFRGWDYAMKHPEEMADYILSLPGVKERGVTKKALMFEAEEMSKLILPSLVEIGHMSETRWQDILDIYKGLNLIGKTKTLEGFIYNQQKASEENFLETGLIIMSVILVIVALLFAYSISLKRAVTKRTKELEAEIIQRKKQEAGLEKISNELKLSNSELQQFAYLTSHNLRAPVTNLRSLLKLFDKGSLVEKNKILFEKIEFSVNNFNQMLSDLNEILSVRREAAAPPEEISFAQELDHVMSSINETISEQQLKVKADFSIAPVVNCPQEIMHSILLNLITNTIKYKKQATQPEINFTTNNNGEFIILKARDEGIGMNLNKHGNRIFNLYQRFHPQIEGKGLGLYLVKTQVEKMGGKIVVESEENEGATFSIYFRKNHYHAGGTH